MIAAAGCIIDTSKKRSAQSNINLKYITVSAFVKAEIYIDISHLEHARAVDGATSRKSQTPYDDWKLIKSSAGILKLFQHATKMIGGSKYPTLSIAKSLLYKLSQEH